MLLASLAASGLSVDPTQPIKHFTLSADDLPPPLQVAEYKDEIKFLKIQMSKVLPERRGHGHKNPKATGFIKSTSWGGGEHSRSVPTFAPGKPRSDSDLHGQPRRLSIRVFTEDDVEKQLESFEHERPPEDEFEQDNVLLRKSAAF